jgi:thymidylate synthase ThyX
VVVAKPPSLTRRVYAVWGVPPETQAYAMAKYSRSAQGMLESIGELSQQRAAEFLETFYFQYGHASIADLAHLAVAFEQLSMLAAIRVVDEPLWDGQERSTRYQPFARTGYHVPDSVIGTPLEERYRAVCDGLFAEYQALSRELTELLKQVVARPEDMDEGYYTRTLRARAFDVARYLLPLATRTSVGQITSARVLEGQISRLLSDPLPECREIGRDLRDACERPAEAPLLRRIADGLNGSGGELHSLLDAGAAPTLVKYAAASPYREQSAASLADVAARLLAHLPSSRPGPLAELAPPSQLEQELVATLLYRHDRGRRSYRQLLDFVGGLPAPDRQAVLDAALQGRGKHDHLLREHRAGYPLTFELTMDVGAFRDMHRHRRCIQVVRDPDPADGYDDPADVFAAGLGEAGAALAAEAGLPERYRAVLDRAFEAAAELRPALGDEALYLLPMAARVRALFKMDYAETAYICEIRTGATGHFSYRRVAWAMRETLRERHPTLAATIRATDPYQPIDFLKR